MDRPNAETTDSQARLSPALLEELYAQPWRHGFFSLLRRMAADPRVVSIGTAVLPRHEPFRIGQQPSLAFAPREVASVEQIDDKLMIRLFSLGMLGPNGPLPLHITEIARERKELRKDATLVDFLDVFHHRALTQFYRAWASAQSVVSLDHSERERFSFYIANLTGRTVEEVRSGVLSAHTKLSASPHLVRQARNRDGLRTTLAHYFGVPVHIEEFIFHWIELSPSSTNCLGVADSGSTMGVNAFLGAMVPDRQYKFRIVIGPLDFETYRRFTPQGDDLIKLVEWVRVFYGQELIWELELKIKSESAPMAVVGGMQQLGWSGWLGRSPSDQPITGMRFEPERYMQQLQV